MGVAIVGVVRAATNQFFGEETTRKKKIALVIAVSGILHVRSQHSYENVIMESPGDT